MNRTKTHSFNIKAFDGAGHAGTLHLEAGQQVFAEGDVADAMFRVDSGLVKLTTRIHSNRTAGIAIIMPGECFGVSVLAADARRANTATSVQNCTIRRVSKQALAQRLRNELPLSRLFVAYLLARISDAETDRAHQLVNSSEQRLARLLLQLSERRHTSQQADLELDQATLAEMVGTTRSRVSYFMNRFRKMGFIRYNGTLQVEHDKLAAFLHRRSKPRR